MFFCWRAILDERLGRLRMMGDAIERVGSLGSRYTRGQIFGGQGDQIDGSQGGEGGMRRATLRPSPFRGLAFQYLGAHGPRGVGNLAPWAFVLFRRACKL